MDRTEPRRAPSGSQSKLPRWLLFVLLAAVIFRLVTESMEKKPDEGAGLVRWQSGGAAGAIARATGKPLLYDFTAEWCAPCKILDREGWGDVRIARMVGEGFVPVRVMDRMQEEGRNPPDVAALQARYRISSFPTLVVADAAGREVSRHVGWRSPAALREFLEGAREKGRSTRSDVPPR